MGPSLVWVKAQSSVHRANLSTPKRLLPSPPALTAPRGAATRVPIMSPYRPDLVRQYLAAVTSRDDTPPWSTWLSRHVGVAVGVSLVLVGCGGSPSAEPASPDPAAEPASDPEPASAPPEPEPADSGEQVVKYGIPM
jgi:hypothetical protein